MTASVTPPEQEARRCTTLGWVAGLAVFARFMNPA
jgi:hypothetical protein